MNGTLSALLVLLDDPDPAVFESVKGQFNLYGTEVIPELEKAWETTPDESLRERIEDLIDDIQFRQIKTELKAWLANESNELLKGACLLAKFQFPDLMYEDINLKIEQLKYDVWLELSDNLTALEKVKVLNHVIFELHKFSGDVKTYFNPRNSYINQVLELKKGNPISLAIIYSEIARRLQIPIYGVNLPKNFVVAYLDENLEKNHLPPEERDVLFYINPFNKGIVFSRKDIDTYLEQQKLKQEDTYYKPCDTLAIMQRIIQNLIQSYQQAALDRKVKNLEELAQLLGA
ncbi:MAG: transglutaminase-like domain-containing protein [Bacteroidales bacterium]|nr:transglutaminase-like domain-containing protein [Bacteroidales bacterium]